MENYCIFYKQSTSFPNLPLTRYNKGTLIVWLVLMKGEISLFEKAQQFLQSHFGFHPSVLGRNKQSAQS
jgi:hypothetical protein